MYAVILAGGGGTRLWPLSRPETPKPFLPLLGEESLLQRTIRRLLEGSELDLRLADLTVVTDRRYERLVHDQLPDIRVLAEPMGRNTAAAIALATLAIDRPEDEVMLVLPADSHIDPAREGVYRAVLAAAEEELATGAFGIDSPLVTLGVQMMSPATHYGYLIPYRERKQERRLTAYVLRAFEEKPSPSRAQELFDEGAGIAWNAGIFLWRRRAIRDELNRYTGLLGALGPNIASHANLERAYLHIQRPMSIDHAVMESAAQSGQVAMGAMVVGWSDLGTWTALLGAIGTSGDGFVVQVGETVHVERSDLVVRRVDARVAAVAPLEAGSMTATQPVAVLRGVGDGVDRVRAMLDRVSRWEARP